MKNILRLGFLTLILSTAFAVSIQLDSPSNDNYDENLIDEYIEDDLDDSIDDYDLSTGETNFLKISDNSRKLATKILDLYVNVIINKKTINEVFKDTTIKTEGKNYNIWHITKDYLNGQYELTLGSDTMDIKMTISTKLTSDNNSPKSTQKPVQTSTPRPIQTNTQKPLDTTNTQKPIQTTIAKSPKTTTPRPIQTTTPRPLDTSTARPIQTSTQKPVQTSSPRQLETSTARPIQTSTQKPVQTTIAKSPKTTTQKPLETSTPRPIQTTSTARPIQTTTPRPLETSTPRPIQTTTPRPLETSTPRPIQTTTSRPLETSTSRPIQTTTSRPLETSTSRPIQTTTQKPIQTTTSRPLETNTARPIETTPVDSSINSLEDKRFRQILGQWYLVGLPEKLYYNKYNFRACDIITIYSHGHNYYLKTSHNIGNQTFTMHDLPIDKLDKRNAIFSVDKTTFNYKIAVIEGISYKLRLFHLTNIQNTNETYIYAEKLFDEKLLQNIFSKHYKKGEITSVSQYCYQD